MVIMTIKKNNWHIVALLTLGVIIIITGVLIPLRRNVQAYILHSKLRHQEYANANVRDKNIHSSFPNVFGYCYVEVKYDFVYKGQIISDSSNLNCSHKDTVIVGNTIPTYFNPNNPTETVSDFGLTASGKQLIWDFLYGLGVSAIIIAMCLALPNIKNRHNH